MIFDHVEKVACVGMSDAWKAAVAAGDFDLAAELVRNDLDRVVVPMMEETALYSDLERALARFTKYRYVVRNTRGLFFDTDVIFADDTIIFDRDKFEYGETF